MYHPINQLFRRNWYPFFLSGHITLTICYCSSFFNAFNLKIEVLSHMQSTMQVSPSTFALNYVGDEEQLGILS